MTQSKNVGNTESSNDLSAILTRMSALSLTPDESRALAVTLNMLANSMSSQSNQASASTSAHAAPDDAVAMEPPFATEAVSAIRSPSTPRYHMPPVGSSGPFYVVTRGRQVGVFTNWTATVAPLVLRVPGAVFESVHSRRLAQEMFEEALDDGVVEVVDHTTRRPSRRR